MGPGQKPFTRRRLPLARGSVVVAEPTQSPEALPGIGVHDRSGRHRLLDESAEVGIGEIGDDAESNAAGTLAAELDRDDPPEHILDLRARVRLRHTLVDERCEWQQRMQSVLYHHGAPKRSWLTGGEGRAWLEALKLPAQAREQITVGLAMVDAISAQMDPLDRELRAYARRPVGCRALQTHYGIGPLTSVTILAELGDSTRFSSSRQAVRYAGMDITVHQSDSRRAPGRLSRQGPSALRWALFRGRPVREEIELTRSRLLRRGRSPARRQPRLPGNRPQAPEAQLPHAARARQGGLATGMRPVVRAKPFVTPMRRGRLPAFSRRREPMDGLHRPSGRNASSNGITPSTIMSPIRSQPESWTETRLGVRVHNTCLTYYAHGRLRRSRSLINLGPRA